MTDYDGLDDEDQFGRPYVGSPREAWLRPGPPNYATGNRCIFQPTNLPNDPGQLAALRHRNNPDKKPVGSHTGRCGHCGSTDLWDDNLAYGCNCCGAMLGGN